MPTYDDFMGSFFFEDVALTGIELVRAGSDIKSRLPHQVATSLTMVSEPCYPCG